MTHSIWTDEFTQFNIKAGKENKNSEWKTAFKQILQYIKDVQC